MPDAGAPPAVSVLMSVRNGRPYIEAAIDSIRAQTLRDWELVIADNASTDDTAGTIERIARHEPRIRFVRIPCDLGHSGGLNRGLALCEGHWVARMDADDIALPDRLERQLGFAVENPDALATSCLAHYIDAAGQRVGRTVSDLCTREDFRRYYEQNLPIGLLHPGAFIERALLQSLGGYRPEYDPANDIDLWCRLADKTVVLAQPEYLMEYRIHPESLSAQKYELARLKHLWARDSMIARREGNPEPPWEQFLAERNGAPWWMRLDRWRKMQAKRLYRQAGQDRVSAKPGRALAAITASALLQPGYTIPRLKAQLSR